MKKTFDCVKMMRDIRAKLSKRYYGRPELMMKELRETRAEFEKRCAAKRHAIVAESPASYSATKR
jgi:hypothetical protein